MCIQCSHTRQSCVYVCVLRKKKNRKKISEREKAEFCHCCVIGYNSALCTRTLLLLLVLSCCSHGIIRWWWLCEYVQSQYTYTTNCINTHMRACDGWISLFVCVFVCRTKKKDFLCWWSIYIGCAATYTYIIVTYTSTHINKNVFVHSANVILYTTSCTYWIRVCKFLYFIWNVCVGNKYPCATLSSVSHPTAHHHRLVRANCQSKLNISLEYTHIH